MLNKDEILNYTIEKLKNFSQLTENDVVQAVQMVCDEWSSDYPVDDNWWAELFYILRHNGIKFGRRSELQESAFSQKLTNFLSQLWSEPTEQGIVKQLLKNKQAIISKGEQGKEYIKNFIEANKALIGTNCSDDFADELNRLANDYLAEGREQKNLPNVFRQNGIKRLNHLLELQLQRNWNVEQFKRMLSEFKAKFQGRILDTYFWQYFDQALHEETSLNIIKATVKLAIERLKEFDTNAGQPGGYNEAIERVLSEAPEMEFVDDFAKAIKGGYEGFVNELKQWAHDPKVHQFLQSGLKDGQKDDDKFGVEIISVPAYLLIPTQNEIDIAKSLEYNIKSTQTISLILNGDNIAVGGQPIVTFNGKYIIDGHHRWSQVYCGNPKANLKCVNFKKTSMSPAEMLKAVQVAIAATTGTIPISHVHGANLLTASEEEIKQYVLERLTDGVFAIYKHIKRLKSREEVANYIWGNCRLMQQHNQPISGAPARGYMPQTNVPEGNLKNVVNSLTRGFANPVEPYVMENKNSMKRKNDLDSLINEALIGGGFSQGFNKPKPSTLNTNPLDESEDDTEFGEETTYSSGFNKDGEPYGFDDEDSFDEFDRENQTKDAVAQYDIHEDEGNIPECEKCSSEKVSPVSDNGLMRCKDCGYVWMPAINEGFGEMHDPVNDHQVGIEKGGRLFEDAPWDDFMGDEDVNGRNKKLEEYSSPMVAGDEVDEDGNPKDIIRERVKPEKPVIKRPNPNATPPELGTSDDVRHMTKEGEYNREMDLESLEDRYNEPSNTSTAYDRLKDKHPEWNWGEAENEIHDEDLQAAANHFDRMKKKNLSEALSDTLDSWLSGDNKPKEIKDTIKKDTESSDIQTDIVKGTTKSAEEIEKEQEIEFDDVEVWKEYIKSNFKGSVTYDEREQAFDEDSETIYAMSGDDIIGVFKSGYGKLIYSTYDEVEKEELDKKLEDTVFKQEGPTLKESKMLKETGEWDEDDEEMQAIKEELQGQLDYLQMLVGTEFQIGDIVGFDKYQGAYCVCQYKGKRFKFWVDEHGQLLDEKTGAASTPENWADYLRSGSPMAEAEMIEEADEDKKVMLAVDKGSHTGVPLKDLSTAEYVTIPRSTFEQIFYRLVDSFKNDWSKISQYNVWKVINRGAEKFKVQNTKAKNWIYNIPVGKLLPTQAPVVMTEDTTTADIAVFDAPATLVQRKQKFYEFVQENCQINGYIKRGKFDMDGYLKSRPSWFKKQLVEEFNRKVPLQKIKKKVIKEGPVANYSDSYFANKSYAMNTPMKSSIQTVPETEFTPGAISFTPYDESGAQVGRTQMVKCSDIEQLKKVLNTYKRQYMKAKNIIATINGKKVGIISEALLKESASQITDIEFDDDSYTISYISNDGSTKTSIGNINQLKDFLKKEDWMNWDEYNETDTGGNEDYPQGFGSSHNFREYWSSMPTKDKQRLLLKFLSKPPVTIP
jgi:hypothetical protein